MNRARHLNDSGSAGRADQSARRSDAAIAVVRRAFICADPNEALLVDENLKILAQEFEEIPADELTTAYCESSFYFDSIGLPGRALELANDALLYAKRTDDSRLLRRTYSVVGMCYARVFHFEEAWRHLNISLASSRTQSDLTGEMATLTNIGSLLEIIGLPMASRSVAINVERQLSTGPTIARRLRFQNAVNSLRWCAATGDLEQGERFLAIAGDMRVACEPILSEVAVAQFESNAVEFLLTTRSCDRAESFIENLSTRMGRTSNVQVAVLAELAVARRRLVSSDSHSIDISVRSLESLLRLVKSDADIYEELLFVLVELTRKVNRAVKEIDRFAAPLRKHLLKVNYRGFFVKSDLELSAYAAFSERIVEELDFLHHPNSECPWQAHEQDEDPRYQHRMRLALSSINVHCAEWRSRSKAYASAEDVALSVEILRGTDEAHCFLVGFLVRCIYLESGMTVQEADVAEFASRFHDVGMVAVHDVRVHDRISVKGDWHVMRTHTVEGERLLRGQHENVFVRAARIAKEHHEWWNGCGVPEGKRADEISFDGRACAVANMFASFIAGDHSWTLQEAINQLETMAGVQLDPILVDLFISRVLDRQDVVDALTSRHSVQ